MRPEVNDIIEQLRIIGTKYTFDGPFVADFIQKLDEVLEVFSVDLDLPKLDILVGGPKDISSEKILEIIAMATLLNITASGVEKTPWGTKIWFEWYVHSAEF
jgi:hypothetical protein